MAEVEFSKKALLGATGAAIWDLAETTGGAILGLLGKPTPKELLERLRKQWAGALPGLPRNHDLVRGLRTAHLAALDRVARAHAKALEHYPASDVSPHDRDFARWLRGWLDDRLRRLLTELDFEAVTAGQVQRALDDMIHPSETEGFAAQALAARRAAEDEALAELAAASAAAVPDFFAASFRGAGGWYDIYALFVNEEIKTNERFRSIFLAAELVDLKRLVTEVEARITAAQAAGVQALAFRLDSFEHWLREAVAALAADLATVKDTTARIEDEVGRVPEATAEAVLAALERRGVLRAAESEGFDRNDVLQLTRRLTSEEALDLAQAIAALERAVEIAVAAIRRGERGSDDDAFMDRVLAEVARLRDGQDAALSLLRDLDAKTGAARNQADLRWRMGWRSGTLGFGSLLAVGLLALAIGWRGQQQVEAARDTTTAAIAEQGRTTERTMGEAEQRAAARHAELVATISREKGVPVAALRAFFQRIGAEEIAEDQIPAALMRFAEDFLSLRRELERRINAPAEIEALRRSARDALDAGDLSGAAARLAQARSALRAARERMAEEEAAILGEEAAVALLRGDYAAAVSQRQEAARLVAHDPALEWAQRLAQADALYRWGEVRGDPAHLRQAVEVYDRALVLAPRLQRPNQWAATQNNLGNALQTLGARGDDAALRRAVQAYEAALEERARDRAPLDWATTQNNLASALSTLGERGDDAALRRAVQAYEAALEELTRDRAPLGWATTQNNLGIALVTLGARGGDAALRRAVQAFEAALEERTRDRAPLDWATTQNNLASALSTLGERGDDAALRRAVQAYEAALEELTRDRAPLGWATTQNNLGIALRTLGARGDDAALRRAVQAFEAALEERTRDRAPLDWAGTQNNLGNALRTLGARGDDAALRRAVQAYEAALEEFTRDRAPLNWAVIQNNLGNALQTLGERGDDAALRRAVQAYEAALEERTRDRAPLAWAVTQNNLGIALETLGERGDDAALRSAVQAFEAALEVFRLFDAPAYVGVAERNLAQARALLAARR